MADQLIIFDTTLRDGEQSPGASMTKDEKLRIARQLERLKVDVIEAGFAASSNGDFEAVKAIADHISVLWQGLVLESVATLEITGLSETGHYSSARDMAVIAGKVFFRYAGRYAMPRRGAQLFLSIVKSRDAANGDSGFASGTS